MSQNAAEVVPSEVAEVWLPISGFKGYEISSLGRIRRGLKIRKTQNDAKGYPRLTFYCDGNYLKRSVHTLVAATFLGPRPSGYVIRHLDGNATNPAASNLCYGAATENEADKLAHGTSVCGVRHHSNKLTEESVLAIRSSYKPGSKSHSLRALAVEFGVSVKTVHAIIQGRIWKHL